MLVFFEEEGGCVGCRSEACEDCGLWGDCTCVGTRYGVTREVGSQNTIPHLTLRHPALHCPTMPWAPASPQMRQLLDTEAAIATEARAALEEARAELEVQQAELERLRRQLAGTEERGRHVGLAVLHGSSEGAMRLRASKACVGGLASGQVGD